MQNLKLNSSVTISNLSSKMIRFEKYSPRDTDYQGYDVAFSKDLWETSEELIDGKSVDSDQIISLISQDLYHLLLGSRFFNRCFIFNNESYEFIDKGQATEELFDEAPLNDEEFHWNQDAYVRKEGDKFLLDHPHSPFVIRSDAFCLDRSPHGLDPYLKSMLMKAGFLMAEQGPSTFFQDLAYDILRLRKDFPRGTFHQGKTIYESRNKAKFSKAGHSTRGHSEKNLIARNDIEKILGSVFSNRYNVDMPYFERRYIQNWPSAGACYEMIPYILINKARDLEPGLYRFNIEKGELETCSTNFSGEGIFNQVALSWGVSHGNPQAVIALASDLGLLMKKYPHDGLKLTFLNSGIVIDKLYEASSERDVGICALGSSMGLDWRKFHVPELNYTIAELAIGLKQESVLDQEI